MEFVRRSAEGINVVVERRYDALINIGAAEGCYAVGLARLMPGTEVVACDYDASAQAVCRELTEKNGVADRVVVSGERGDDFEPYAGAEKLSFYATSRVQRRCFRSRAVPAWT